MERRLALWLCCVRCCTAGAGQRVLCGSVVAMSAAFDAAAWLGGVHEDPELPGQSVQLRPKIVEILGSDTVARRDMEATEASAADIDLFYGWHERVLTKEMQVHYSSMSIKERMKKARITSRM